MTTESQTSSWGEVVDSWGGGQVTTTCVYGCGGSRPWYDSPTSVNIPSYGNSHHTVRHATPPARKAPAHPKPKPRPAQTHSESLVKKAAGAVGNAILGAADQFLGASSMINDVQTLAGSGSWWDKTVAAGDLAMNAGMDISMLVGVGEELRGGELALKGGADLAKHLAESCALSFSYDTTVMTSGGALAIGSLRVGEKVLAYNTQTQHMEMEPIKHVWINHDTDLVNLAITTTTTDKKGQAHEKDEVIHTTSKHPFLTQEEGFVPVSQLHIGLHIRKADGSYGVVSGWQSLPGASTMYNLEVPQDHTYTVGDGQWIVHNLGACDDVECSDTCAGFEVKGRNVSARREE